MLIILLERYIFLQTQRYVATVYIVIIKLLLLKVSSRSKGQVLNVHMPLANLSAVLTIQTCKSMITSSNQFN